MKTKMLRRLALSMAAMALVACQNETLEDETLVLDQAEVTDISTSLSEKGCGTSQNRDGLGSAGSIQGPSSLCTVGSTSKNPGLVDCRVNTKGGHRQSGSWFIYEIVQGNKKKGNNTAVRIERGFKNFKRQAAPKGKKKTVARKQVSFKGTIRVDQLPDNNEGKDSKGKNKPDNFKEDFTYVCQMHGSGSIRESSNKSYNGKKHTSAIWLLRAHRTSKTRFKFSIEFSKGPIGSGIKSERGTVDVATNLQFGKEYKIEVSYGYDDKRKFGGFISAAGKKKFVPKYNFVTDQQYFRYGAYRAGKKVNPSSKDKSDNRSKILWKNNASFCNP